VQLTAFSMKSLLLAFAMPAVLAAAEYDLVIYGGTSASITAAVQAKKMGKSVIILSPDKHLGGLSSGGLGYTDTGNKAAIGGLSRDFYHRVWQHYQKDSAWVQQKRAEYGNKGQGTVAMDGENRTMWIFEPHVAEQVFEDYVKEYGLRVVREAWLDRVKGVTREDGRITSITMLDGTSYSGRMFMDTTYEGDLMAAAGVTYHVGREAKAKYGEEWNGVQTGVLHHRHHFGKMQVDPYVVRGDPGSGLLPEISAEPPGVYGEEDRRVQAYCFRMCLSRDPSNRLPFPKPAGYDPKRYELLLRVYEKGWKETFEKFDVIPNHKTDTNNHGPFSTDHIGANYDYPDASYERRREIIADHVAYQQGWLYFIANDPRVPAAVRKEMQEWGLPKDEFTDNGGWSHQLYIREARRMVGHFVMTENELLKRKPTPEPVGMGSYTIDSHNVQRYVTPEGHVQNEGDIGAHLPGPYEIAYGALLPQKGQCQNLSVPVACSASHMAYGSIRREPVFMILGQSAATAACLALDGGVALQDLPYEQLKARLLADGQVLTYSGPTHARAAKGVDASKLKGVVVDDEQAVLTGAWKTSSAAPTFLHGGYSHDNNARDGKCTAAFTATPDKAGNYEILLAAPNNTNRASNAKVTLHLPGGQTTEQKVNLREAGRDGLFHSLGRFPLPAGSPVKVVVSNEGADGYVVVDGVQWLPLE
jgi:hypothetical protein